MPLDTLPSAPPLDKILSKINLTCRTGKTIIGVYVNVGGKPIRGVNVRLVLGPVIPIDLYPKLEGKSTNSAGVVGYCVSNRQYVEAWIQKPGMAFGSNNVGEWHRLGSISGWTRGLFVPRPYIFNYIAAPITYIPERPILPITPPALPVEPPTPLPTPRIPQPPEVCTAWDTVATPNVPAAVSASFPISVSGAKWECKDFAASELINGMGKIEFEGRTFDLPIQNGYGRVNLGDLVDLSGYTGLPTVKTVPTVPSIPPYISPLAPGSTTVTLYLNEYLRKGILTPARGGKWGAGYFSRSGEYCNIHYVGNGYDGSIGIPCRLNKPKTHRYFGDYTVTVLSVQNLGLDNASYTVKIKL